MSGSGLGWGLLGVLAFSFTLPFTRIAVGSDTGLDPLFVGAGRAVVAGILAAVVLLAFRVPLPEPRQWAHLVPVSAGVVAGFPILTSLAMRHTTAGHAAVIIGLLPAATAVVAVLLTHERPSARFWCGVGLGVVATVLFSIAAHGSVAGGGIPDVLLVGAVALGAVGYAQGGRMARELGSWQTICWALVLAFPVMAFLSARSYHLHPPTGITVDEWLAFGYVSVISMFLGFFAWYRGLAIGPMTTVSQVQLVQPVLSLLWAILLLDEQLTPTLIIGAIAVVGATAFTVRARVRLGVAGPVRLHTDHLVDQLVVVGDVDVASDRDGIERNSHRQPRAQYDDGLCDVMAVEEADVAQQRAQRAGR